MNHSYKGVKLWIIDSKGTRKIHLLNLQVIDYCNTRRNK